MYSKDLNKVYRKDYDNIRHSNIMYSNKYTHIPIWHLEPN